MATEAEQYKILSNYYVDTIKDFFNYTREADVIPKSCIVFLPFVNDYIEDNKLFLIENGLVYILQNKEYIETFSIENLKNEDNSKIMSDFKHIIDKKNNTEIKIIFDILDNTKKLNKTQQKIVKEYMDMIILILEKINKLIS